MSEVRRTDEGYSLHRTAVCHQAHPETPRSLGGPQAPLEPLELVCEPDVDYIPWQDDVPEIEVG